MKITIIIPHFNNLEALKLHLDEIIKRSQNAQLIIVDDGSTDGSVSYILQRYPKILLVEKKRNEGFSSAVNSGVKRADGEIIVLLNHDVVPSDNYLSKIIRHFQDDLVFAVGCLDLSHEGNQIVKRGRGIGWFHRGFLQHNAGSTDKENTLWVSCGSGAFRKSIWNKLGGLENLYNPFYWEDIDLSYRAMKSGYKVIFDSQCIVDHYHESGVIRLLFSRSKIRIISYRNQIQFVWLNITSRKYLISHIIYLLFTLVERTLKGDFSFGIGFFYAFLRIPRILKRRWKRLTLFNKTDEEVLKEFQSEMNMAVVQ